MIRIKRTTVPTVLENSFPEKTYYNKKDVVKALWDMQYGKCCYCEQKIPEEGHLKAVEHFHPQTTFFHLRNNWENLLLACAQCNGKKSNKFPEILSDNYKKPKVINTKVTVEKSAAIIDPSNHETDPEDHISFDFSKNETDDEYGIIQEKDNSLLGKTTIESIGLNSRFYMRKRQHYHDFTIGQCYISLLQATHERHEGTLNSCKSTFRLLMSAEGEFAAFVRAFARHKKLDQPPVNLDIPHGYEI